MATDLRQIPGATAPSRRAHLFRRRRARPWRPPEKLPTMALRDARQSALGGPSRKRPLLGPRRSVSWSSWAIGLGFVALGLLLARGFWNTTRVDVDVRGFADGSVLTLGAAATMDVRIAVEQVDQIGGARLTVNGRPIDREVLQELDDGWRWRPDGLLEGDYELALSVPRPMLANADFSWTFTVDDTPPGIDIPNVAPPAPIGEPVTVSGRVEPGTELFVAGEPFPHVDGAFTLAYDRPPAAPISILAVDEAGNETHAEVVVPVRYPGTQGVHVTAAAWNYGPLREPVLDIVDAGLVSTIELDLKDEGGIVGYDSEVELAHRIGAVRPEYDLAETVAVLKARGMRIVGRIVAFRDEPLARWAWENDERDWVIQTPDGDFHGAYGGFTNPASPAVQDYNLAIAREAVDAGVDDIMWDYVRRPEGDLEQQRYPGWGGTPEDAIVEFLARGHEQLRARGAYQGAAVFGISADRPFAVAQDIPRMSRHVDYVSPMVYPSHFVKGEYRVKDPNRQPYDIVHAVLADFQETMAGSGRVLVPWLQDFSLGHTYGPAEVRGQIDAGRDLGIDSWLLWNAGVRYTSEALDPALIP